MVERRANGRIKYLTHRAAKLSGDRGIFKILSKVSRVLQLFWGVWPSANLSEMRVFFFPCDDVRAPVRRGEDTFAGSYWQSTIESEIEFGSEKAFSLFGPSWNFRSKLRWEINCNGSRKSGLRTRQKLILTNSFRLSAYFCENALLLSWRECSHLSKSWISFNSVNPLKLNSHFFCKNSRIWKREKQMIKAAFEGEVFPRQNFSHFSFGLWSLTP